MTKPKKPPGIVALEAIAAEAAMRYPETDACAFRFSQKERGTWVLSEMGGTSRDATWTEVALYKETLALRTLLVLNEQAAEILKKLPWDDFPPLRTYRNPTLSLVLDSIDRWKQKHKKKKKET